VNWTQTQAHLGLQVFQRGWLSSNNVLLRGAGRNALVDSGYCTHSGQTIALVQQALGHEPLHLLCNTHLHSDHCGGNAALQAHFETFNRAGVSQTQGLQTLIPPGDAAAVREWNESQLSFLSTGQRCPRFGFDDLLVPGQSIGLGLWEWQIHAAPGHDPHSVILFEPQTRTLISADALWQNGFGVIFPELVGEPGFDEVQATLDLIESLKPLHVIPGHGAPFDDVEPALARACSRLAQFVSQPDKHLSYALKVLLKFHLLEVQHQSFTELHQWAAGVPYLVQLQNDHASQLSFDAWLKVHLNALVQSGAARWDNDRLFDVSN
jgi:glyoxylase-like metal-dependent hydrolase (beta-lactamase superfamily II)